MQYRTLSNLELAQEAERDPRYATDPLFAELTQRVREQKDQESRRTRTSSRIGVYNQGAVLPTDGRPS